MVLWVMNLNADKASHVQSVIMSLLNVAAKKLIQYEIAF